MSGCRWLGEGLGQKEGKEELKGSKAKGQESQGAGKPKSREEVKGRKAKGKPRESQGAGKEEILRHYLLMLSPQLVIVFPPLKQQLLVLLLQSGNLKAVSIQ